MSKFLRELVGTEVHLDEPSDEDSLAFLADLDAAAGMPSSSASVLPEIPNPDDEPLIEPSPPLKRRKRDPRPGVFASVVTAATTVTTSPLSSTSAQQSSAHVSLDQDFPIIEENVSEEEEEFVISGRPSHASGSGSSSAQGPPGGDPHLDATLKLAHHFAAEDEIRPSQAGIHMGASKGKQSARDTDQIICDLEDKVTSLKQKLIEKDILIGTLDVRVSDLEKEKDKQAGEISSLQANLGGLTALVYDLKSKLSQKLGAEFGSSAVPVTTMPVSRTPLPPAPDVTLHQYMTSDPVRKRGFLKKKKGTTLVHKPSDQNLPGDTPHAFLTDLGKKKFVDKYGDRSGIKVWGFDDQRNMWVVKRKSGRIEYYQKETDFFSWTRTDLSELLNAPFFNPRHVVKARDFVNFLKRQSKSRFEYLHLADSFTKKAKDVIDPRTGKTYKNVMWPATKKVKKVPMAKPLPDGSLDFMEFWVYDVATSTVVIKLPRRQIRIVDPRDLLMFGERDIQTLSREQIKVTDESHEEATKEFTAMLAKILNERLWAGALAERTDVELVDL